MTTMLNILVQPIYKLLKSFVTLESCPRRLVASLCVGIYIAFSPFVGLHTIMAFAFSWLFALNSAVVLAVSVIINNPCTMLPIYAADYILGAQVLGFLGFNSVSANPYWLTWANQLIATYTDFKNISLWAFLLGGNLLGVSISVMVYPILKRVLLRFMKEKI